MVQGVYAMLGGTWSREPTKKWHTRRYFMWLLFPAGEAARVVQGLCSQSYHTETAGAKLFEESCRVRVLAAPREVAGAGLGQHRQVDAKESASEMCGTEQGQIQLQKVPGQEGQDRSVSHQAKGLK